VTRLRLLAIWLLCAAVTPVLLLGMLLQAIGGAQHRALGIAVGLDEAGNALFGGSARQTISSRTGKALVRGERWARIVAPCIDFFFGAGHCLSHANDAP
jgi:hypothetical protein